MNTNGLPAALAKYSHIEAPDDVEMISAFYRLFKEKAPFSAFVETLAGMKNRH